MLLPLMRDRLLTALAGTPDVLDGLLGVREPAGSHWDDRPDPARFTLREILAHLVDYETIWLERLMQTRLEAGPVLRLVDPEQLALDHDYAYSDGPGNQALFRQRREALVQFLRSLAEAEWQRAGQMADRGPLTLEEQAAFVVIHDGYHTSQVAQWLAHRT